MTVGRHTIKVEWNGVATCEPGHETSFSLESRESGNEVTKWWECLGFLIHFTTVQFLIAYGMHAPSNQKLELERPGNKARKWDPVHRVLLVMCRRVSSRVCIRLEEIIVYIHTAQQTVTQMLHCKDIWVTSTMVISIACLLCT